MLDKGPSEANKSCDVLLRHNMVHFISTDAHGFNRRRPLIKEVTLYAQSTITSLNNPTGLTVKELNYNSANLTWSSVSTLLTSIISLSCTNTGLTTNSTYYYKVRVYKIVGTNKVYSGYTTTVFVK